MKDKIVLIEYIKKYYFEIYGLAVQNILLIYFALNKLDLYNIDLFSKEIQDTKNTLLVLFFIISILIVNLIWIFLNYAKPRHDDSKNTILFCIKANKYSDYKYVKKILEFRVKNVIEENTELNMQVLFTKYLASKGVVKKHKKVKSTYFLKNKYNLVFFCNVVNEWKDNTIPVAELTSDMGVITSSITKETQKLFMKDLSQLLEKYLIRSSNDYNDGLEFSTEVIIILEYVSVIASLLSNNPFYSLKAIEDLREKIKTCDSRKKSIGFIKTKFDFTFEQILLSCSIIEYNKYLDNKITDLTNLYTYLENMKRCKGIYYDYLLLKAAVVMLETRNTKAARELIIEAKNTKHKEEVWRLSIAFLDCYDGELLSSYLNYKKALMVDYYDYLGIEIYILKIYESEKSKYQLDFALGLLNELIKKDYYIAKEHYNEFISNALINKEYPDVIEIAKKRFKKIENFI